ncbi:unnamed protein product [Mytilus edulis]|uniref:Uncharacterized protein n=1 Tax=Mytilus edulis TaxID=6550 RepID=A0A8S3QA43_MYTED|nr:unnamed protein product [Mytilus edulis]
MCFNGCRREKLKSYAREITGGVTVFILKNSTNVWGSRGKLQLVKEADHLEKKLCQETDIIWNQEKSKATDFISEIEVKTKSLREMKEHLQTVTSQTSKLQSFLGVHQIEQQVHQCQRYVEDLDDDERTKEVDIKMKQNDEIEKILNKNPRRSHCYNERSSHEYRH